VKQSLDLNEARTLIEMIDKIADVWTKAGGPQATRMPRRSAPEPSAAASRRDRRKEHGAGPAPGRLDRRRRARPPPAVGEIVLARDPRARERFVIKRVAAVSERACTLLGDHPEESTDSRQFGPVALADVVGRAVFRYAPRGASAASRAVGKMATWGRPVHALRCRA